MLTTHLSLSPLSVHSQITPSPSMCSVHWGKVCQPQSKPPPSPSVSHCCIQTLLCPAMLSLCLHRNSSTSNICIPCILNFRCVCTVGGKLEETLLRLYNHNSFSSPQHPAIDTMTTALPTAWMIELSLSSGEVVQHVTQRDADSNMAMLTDLEPGKEYQVRVAGENTRGTGLFSEYVRTMTHPGKICPSK